MNQKGNAELGILAVLAAIVWSLALTGCSVKFEVGYHGQSGRDDRTQTELIQEYKRAQGATKDRY